MAIRSKISLTKLFKIAIALFEIPVSGCTCLSTKRKHCQMKTRVTVRNTQTHLCRYKRSMFPFGPSFASSSRRLQLVQPLLSFWQILRPQQILPVPWRQWQQMQVLFRQWRLVWVPLQLKGWAKNEENAMEGNRVVGRG